MSAALVRRAVLMWQSTQVTETLSFPPTNHFACGGSQSRTVSHFLNHSSSLACSSQNPSGSVVARSYIDLSDTCALRAKDFGGGNFLFSCRSEWIWLICFVCVRVVPFVPWCRATGGLGFLG